MTARTARTAICTFCSSKLQELQNPFRDCSCSSRHCNNSHDDHQPALAARPSNNKPMKSKIKLQPPSPTNELNSEAVRPIPQTFKANGFTFRLLQREGDVALFEKTRPSLSHVGFEVVIIQKLKARIIYGRAVPGHEAMPSPSAWGRLGWTPHNSADAWRRFRELAEKRRECPSLREH